MNFYLGLDPDLAGAIALVDRIGHFILVEDMPIAARGHGRVKHEVDAGGIAHLLRPHVVEVAFGIVESVGARPGQGVAGTFSLGHSLGTATAALVCLGIPHELLPPTKWKRLAELSADKAVVLAAARRRWPEAPLAFAKHHGRAEALFLALLAMRRHRD